MAERKFPIAWWEECIRNRRASLVAEEERLARLAEQVAKTRKEVEFEEWRLMWAKSTKRDSYSHDYKRKARP